MWSKWKLAVIVGVYGYFMACAPVSFEKEPELTCREKGEVCPHRVTCEGDSCFKEFTETRKVGSGLVDILIVNDNSGSMSFARNHVADRFDTFVASLGKLDYRIGIITTDVSVSPDNPKRAANGNGTLWDGYLLPFPDKSTFLTRSHENASTLFRATIARPETKVCEEELKAAKQAGRNANGMLCPSSDERGIYAANLAIDRNQDGFIRPKGHLAVIFLADEDVRSSHYRYTSPDPNNRDFRYEESVRQAYALTALDKPETLVDKIKQKFPSKPFSVHAIIVKPGDEGCLKLQSDQDGVGVKGSEGRLYATAAEGRGKIADICANDYGNQLGEIGFSIADQVNDISLNCRPDDYKVTFDPPQQNASVTPDFDNLRIQIGQGLAPETTITLWYKCKK